MCEGETWWFRSVAVETDEVIDDSSLMQLDVDLGFEGMKEEIGNLEKCGAGRVIGQAEVDALKKKHPLMRVIQVDGFQHTKVNHESESG